MLLQTPLVYNCVLRSPAATRAARTLSAAAAAAATATAAGAAAPSLLPTISPSATPCSADTAAAAGPAALATPGPAAREAVCCPFSGIVAAGSAASCCSCCSGGGRGGCNCMPSISGHRGTHPAACLLAEDCMRASSSCWRDARACCIQGARATDMHTFRVSSLG